MRFLRAALSGALALALIVGASALIRACSSEAQAKEPRTYRAPILHQRQYGNTRNWYGKIDGKNVSIYERSDGPRVRTWGTIDGKRFEINERLNRR